MVAGGGGGGSVRDARLVRLGSAFMSTLGVKRTTMMEGVKGVGMMLSRAIRGSMVFDETDWLRCHILNDS